MSYQSAIPPAKGSRRKGLLAVGVVVLVGGVGAGAALFVISGSQYESAVEKLQRAPVGCDTEFDFTGTGTFVLYTETKGEVGEIRGDCENAGRDYDHGDGRVRVSLTLADEDGNEVELDRASGGNYDAGGFTGSAVRSVEIEEPGEYTLSVESDDDDFAIAVGRNPKEDADSLKTTGIIVGAAGLVVGLLMILLGMRRKPAPAAPGAPGGGAFATSPSGPFGSAPFGGAPTGTYPQPYQQPGPPTVSPPQQPLPPTTPNPWSPSPPPPAAHPAAHPAPPPAAHPAPPPAPGDWGAPS